MAEQNLSDYIQCVASKKLSTVEIDKFASNQHELNGVSQLKGILGSDSTKPVRFPTTFAYLSDTDGDCVSQNGTMTWYDARAQHPTRSEFRLYYDSDAAFASAHQGDSLYLIRRTDGSMITLVCEKGSAIESQVNWLFDLKEGGRRFDVREIVGGGLSFAAKTVLDLIGVDTGPDEDADIAEMLAKYSDFPPSAEFSEYARTFVDIDPVNRPDDALMAWLSKEETFFKALEKKQIKSVINELAEGINGGRDDDELVSRFIGSSLSFQNRRKSRAGYSFEHHLKAMFDANGVSYSWQRITENNRKPDFVMPSIEMYHDPDFPSGRLTMLAAKTTCKERWTEMIKEAERIPCKHLATIEPAISTKQLDVMRSENVQLVVPEQIRGTYKPNYAEWIWNMDRFIQHALVNQD